MFIRLWKKHTISLLPVSASFTSSSILKSKYIDSETALDALLNYEENAQAAADREKLWLFKVRALLRFCLIEHMIILVKGTD